MVYEWCDKSEPRESAWPSSAYRPLSPPPQRSKNLLTYTKEGC